MEIRGIFVTATDSGVGQTTVAGALAAALTRQGQRVAVFKPVQTGCALDETAEAGVVDGVPGEADAEARAALGRLAALAGAPPAPVIGRTPAESLVARDARFLMRLAQFDAPLELVNPYRFPSAVDPAAAARVAETEIDVEHLLDCMVRLAAEADLVVVDGEGGTLTPLSEHGPRQMVDLIAASGLPALVVAPSRRGTVNHCLLTLEALRRRGVAICGVVLDRLDRWPSAEEAANPLLIERHAGEVVRGVLPWFTEAELQDAEHLAARFRAHVDLEAILSVVEQTAGQS